MNGVGCSYLNLVVDSFFFSLIEKKKARNIPLGTEKKLIS
jgi:hypothetical protein